MSFYDEDIFRTIKNPDVENFVQNQYINSYTYTSIIATLITLNIQFTFKHLLTITGDIIKE